MLQTAPIPIYKLIGGDLSPDKLIERGGYAG
jgi:hypothetical protein